MKLKGSIFLKIILLQKCIKIYQNRLFYTKSIPAIAQSLVYGKFISDFHKKANLFILFFGLICSRIKNSSILSPLSNINIIIFHIIEKDILLIIKSLDTTKPPGSDNLSIKINEIL